MRVQRIQRPYWVFRLNPALLNPSRVIGRMLDDPAPLRNSFSTHWIRRDRWGTT